jgi:hypothetical protein
MAKTPEKLYSMDAWHAALKKVGVARDVVLKASVLLLNEDIARLQNELKTFKPGKR